jgi:hypothetical protein
MMKHHRVLENGQSNNSTCDMFGWLYNFVRRRLVLLFRKEIPTTMVTSKGDFVL